MEITDYTNILTFSSSICIDTYIELLYMLLSLKKSFAVSTVTSLLYYKFSPV